MTLCEQMGNISEVGDSNNWQKRKFVQRDRAWTGFDLLILAMDDDRWKDIPPKRNLSGANSWPILLGQKEYGDTSKFRKYFFNLFKSLERLVY